jgi:DNA-binding protein YbaB
MLMAMDLLAERLQTMRGQLRDIRATEYSPDGLITAVVGGRGELLELELDPRVLREQNASALAKSIMDTVRAAAAAAGRESVRLAESVLGNGNHNGNGVPV